MRCIGTLEGDKKPVGYRETVLAGVSHGGRTGHKAGHGREQIDARWSETEEIPRVAEVVHEVYLLAQESTYGTDVIRAADDT